jgi:hypothetical protein
MEKVGNAKETSLAKEKERKINRKNKNKKEKMKGKMIREEEKG